MIKFKYYITNGQKVKSSCSKNYIIVHYWDNLIALGWIGGLPS